MMVSPRDTRDDDASYTFVNVELRLLLYGIDSFTYSLFHNRNQLISLANLKWIITASNYIHVSKTKINFLEMTIFSTENNKID